MDATFVELAARSGFSYLDGASTPEALARRAADRGMPALALADRFDLGGAVRFHRACERAGVRPIHGAEVTCGDLPPLVLLCEDGEGWRRLSALTTRARLSGPRGEPRLATEALEGRTAGLLCLVRATPAEPASGSLRRLAPLFPGRLYVALEHHGLPWEGRRCAAWREVAGAERVPWVPVNVPRYARPRDRIVRDVLTCVRHDVTLDEAGTRLLPNGEWYLKSAEQMRARWCERGGTGQGGEAPDVGSGGRPPDGDPGGGCPCAGCRALARTREVAARCRFRLPDLEPRLPSFPVPGGGRSRGHLRALVGEGARERYGEDLDRRHRRQVEHELEVIGRLGLSDYFLIMWDVVRFAQRKGILVQGRGSAANSVVCYCLGITAVDPVGRDLLFERFLSEEREGRTPDIDLDIAHEDREEVLQHMYRRWGRDHAAMVCETITYRGRMAVRDAARALGFPAEVADRLSAEAGPVEAEEAARRLAEEGTAAAGLDPGAPRTRALVHAVRGLHRLPRHRSIHVGGFVLTDRPLGETVPVEEASMEGRTVVQWDKDDLSVLGIPKFDLLGLGMLTVLGRTLGHVRATRGRSLDLADLPADDPEVYDMLCEADTVGVFQVESRAQMATLPRVQPREFYDLAIEVALIRPGPIQGDMVHPYLRRRRGEEPVEYVDERLEPVLERTLGVPLFQEQGMRVAVELAGFTPAQADRLRQAMGFKRSERAMREVGEELEAGLRRNGVPEEARERIWTQLTAFAEYGFPESHALSFALLVYASAWLKRHFAPEFLCATLNAQPMGFYGPSTLVEDARRHGVEVRPPDLARSAWDCTLEAGEASPSSDGRDPALRVGLRYVDGLGEEAREKLERAREEGAFTSVEGVVRRTGLEEDQLRALAEAGAFRSLWPGRREALWEVLRELRGDAGPLAPRPRSPAATGGVRQGGRGSASPSLSPSGAAGEASGPGPVPSMSRAERVLADYRRVGLSVEGHPMEFLRPRLERRGVVSAAELGEREAGRDVAVAGLVIVRQRPRTARGVVFVTLEDETGFANGVLTPDVHERFRRRLRAPLVVACGEVEREAGVVNVRVRRIVPIASGGRIEVDDRSFR